MMNNLQRFENEELGFCAEATEHDGTLIFAALSVCNSLGIRNSRDALESLDADEKITVANPDGNPRAGIPHTMNYVTEAGLYSLILRSRKPEAKAFKRWITHEVLPSIRKNGSYSKPQFTAKDVLTPEVMIGVLESLMAEREKNAFLEERDELFGNRTAYGTISPATDNPRFIPVRAYLRSTKSVATLPRPTQYQLTLFDFRINN